MNANWLDRLSAEDRLVWSCVASGSAEEASEMIRTRPIDWELALQTARDNRVLVQMGDVLMSVPEVPPKIKATIIFHEGSIREVVESDRRRFERALPAIVRRNKIMLLRGVAMTYTLDRERPTRLIGTDADLLIDEPQFPSLSGRFLDHHHVPADVIALDPPRLEYHHDLNFKSSWCVRLARFEMSELWERRQRMEIAGIEVSLLGVEDRILYLSFHNVTKGFVGFYRFLDLARVIRASTVDWKVVVDRARRYGVEHALWANLRVLEKLAPDTVPEGVEEQVRPGRFVIGLFDRTFNPAAILHSRVPADTGGGLRYALRRALLFRALLVRPDNFIKILIGPFNRLIFLGYIRAINAPIIGGLIGKTRSALQRE